MKLSFVVPYLFQTIVLKLVGETGALPFPDPATPSKTILVKPPSSSTAAGFASSWSGLHTPLIQITSLNLLLGGSNDQDGDHDSGDHWLWW